MQTLCQLANIEINEQLGIGPKRKHFFPLSYLILIDGTDFHMIS